MKKMMIALVAMFVMTMSASANAQSVNDDTKLTFDRLSSYLDLRIDQRESVKTAMVQFSTSMEAYNQLSDASKAGEAWEKIQNRHKETMKKILDEKQYKKYTQMLDLTAKNTADRLMDESTAAK